MKPIKRTFTMDTHWTLYTPNCVIDQMLRTIVSPTMRITFYRNSILNYINGRPNELHL